MSAPICMGQAFLCSWPCGRVLCRSSEVFVPAQAYDRWLRGDHAHLFIINNDVLVPSGVLTQLMRAMRRGGASRGRSEAPHRTLAHPLSDAWSSCCSEHTAMLLAMLTCP